MVLIAPSSSCWYVSQNATPLVVSSSRRNRPFVNSFARVSSSCETSVSPSPRSSAMAPFTASGAFLGSTPMYTPM